LINYFSSEDLIGEGRNPWERTHNSPTFKLRHVQILAVHLNQ
jgi:hypothetical protein